MSIAPFIQPPLLPKPTLSMWKSYESHVQDQKKTFAVCILPFQIEIKCSPDLLRPSFRSGANYSRDPLTTPVSLANARRPCNLGAIPTRTTRQTGITRTQRHRRRGAEVVPALIESDTSDKGIAGSVAARPAAIGVEDVRRLVGAADAVGVGVAAFAA